MKRLLFLLFATLALHGWGADIAINETNFPDANFRQHVLQYIDTNGDTKLQQTEIDVVTEITVNSKQIASLKGVEYFTKLTSLQCSYNNLTSLDVSMLPELVELTCNNNKLNSLDVSHNSKLGGLGFRHNNLKNIDLSNNPELYIVNAADNQLTRLDVTRNFKMQFIFCSNNKLATINLSNNPKLTILSCFANRLTSLDLSYNPLLNRIELWGNQINDDAMTQLVASLPSVNGTGQFVAYSDDPQDNEGNEFSPRHALALMVKNWTNIICYDNESHSTPYAIEITEERFPDAAFRQVVVDDYDTNGDGWLQVSEMATTTFYCENKGVSSTQGLEYFPLITTVGLYANLISTLNVSGNQRLTQVWCYLNQLKGNAVSEFVASLPTYPTFSEVSQAQGNVYALWNPNHTSHYSVTTEGNDFGQPQITAAAAKGWVIRAEADNYGWSPYEGNDYIIFEDANTEAYCVEHFDTNGDYKLSYAEAAAVRPSQLDFSDTYGGLEHFDEFQYFTGLTYLPEKCFRNVSGLQTITLPNTLKSVSKDAFRNCTHLERITVPEGIKSIRDYAFNNCNLLAAINFPSTLDSIGKYSFSGCRNLANIEYTRQSVKMVGTFAFQLCNKLTSFPFDRVERIEAKAFRSTGLTEVTTNAYHIGQGAFEVSQPITITLLRKYFDTVSGQDGDDSQEGLHLPITSTTPAQGTLVRVDRNIFHDAYNATTIARDCLHPYITLNALEHYEPYEQFDDQGSDAVPFSCEVPVVLPQGSRIFIVTGLDYTDWTGKAFTRAMPGNVVPANTGVVVKLPNRNVDLKQYWYLTVNPNAAASGNYSDNILGASVGMSDIYMDDNMLFEWNAQFYNGEYFYSFDTNMDNQWAEGCTAFLRMPLSQTPSGETGGAGYALDLSTPGDVTGDGNADVSDVNAVINIMLGKASIHDFPGNADINKDETVDVSDVNKVINIMLGKE